MATYEVVVGNVGTVYSGDDGVEAGAEYQRYRELSEARSGRAGGESVVLMSDGEVLAEHDGWL